MPRTSTVSSHKAVYLSKTCYFFASHQSKKNQKATSTAIKKIIFAMFRRRWPSPDSSVLESDNECLVCFIAPLALYFFYHIGRIFVNDFTIVHSSFSIFCIYTNSIFSIENREATFILCHVLKSTLLSCLIKYKKEAMTTRSSNDLNTLSNIASP